MTSIAHVGYGYWGRNLARNFAELGYLKTIVDSDSQAAISAAAALKVGAASFELALADPSIDGLSIASPAELHFSQAKAALLAGKHVFVEKPLALNVDEAEELQALANRSGLKLMVGHLLQYHPAYIRLREMVRHGDLGRILYVYSNRQSLGKFRREENVLWSFAPHDISMLLGLVESCGANDQRTFAPHDISMLLGLVEGDPVHVTAQGNVSYSPGVADMATIQMHFASGASGHVQTCWMHPFKEQKLVVIGDKAMAVFEDSAPVWDDKLKIYRHTISSDGHVPEANRAEAETVPIVRSEPLKAECQHFIDCIETGAEPRTNGSEGLRVLRVLERAERALAENLRLQVTISAEATGL